MEIRETIRIAGIKKAKALGRKPIILANSKQGTVIFQGSEFSRNNGQFAFTAGNLVVNAGDQPQTVLGTVLKQGECGVVNKTGKCTKLEGRIVNF